MIVAGYRIGIEPATSSDSISQVSVSSALAIVSALLLRLLMNLYNARSLA